MSTNKNKLLFIFLTLKYEKIFIKIEFYNKKMRIHKTRKQSSKKLYQNDDVNTSQPQNGLQTAKSPVRDDIEAGDYPSEMLYFEPNEVNALQTSQIKMSPKERSPYDYQTSVITKARNDINQREESHSPNPIMSASNRKSKNNKCRRHPKRN